MDKKKTPKKVFLVEDEKSIREVTREFLEMEGNEVVLEAGSLEEALEKIKEVVQKGVSVAIIDGSLTPHGTSTNDGRMVAERLRKEAPEVKIISFSTLDSDWGDANLGKGSISFQQLARLVTIL